MFGNIQVRFLRGKGTVKSPTYLAMEFKGQVCLKKGKLVITYVEEDIPEEVVEYCDVMDDGDLEVPPRFSCEKCGGEMVPKKYKGIHGIQYEY